MSAHAIQETVTLETFHCCQCSVLFAMPDALVRRRRNEGGNFYCPNGHPQVFSESELDRVRKKLEWQTRFSNEQMERANKAEAKIKRQDKEAKRLAKRAQAGVCSCCHRTFQQLARHMKTKHPEYTG